MMINMLLWTEGDFELVLLSENENGERIYPYAYEKAHGMQGSCWMLVLDDKDDFDALEVALEAEGGLIIIGTYNKDGSQYEWFNQGKANRNHTLAKYHDKLNDVIDYDENGDPIGSHPPTEAEALETQVNKVFGWGNRILT